MSETSKDTKDLNEGGCENDYKDRRKDEQHERHEHLDGCLTGFLFCYLAATHT